MSNTNYFFDLSVVIEKAYRGCGLGRKLMQLTESYASQLVFNSFIIKVCLNLSVDLFTVVRIHPDLP